MQWRHSGWRMGVSVWLEGEQCFVMVNWCTGDTSVRGNDETTWQRPCIPCASHCRLLYIPITNVNIYILYGYKFIFGRWWMGCRMANGGGGGGFFAVHIFIAILCSQNVLSRSTKVCPTLKGVIGILLAIPLLHDPIQVTWSNSVNWIMFLNCDLPSRAGSVDIK
jgi:hypothetical protein